MLAMETSQKSAGALAMWHTIHIRTVFSHMAQKVLSKYCICWNVQTGQGTLREEIVTQGWSENLIQSVGVWPSLALSQPPPNLYIKKLFLLWKEGNQRLPSSLGCHFQCWPSFQESHREYWEWQILCQTLLGLQPRRCTCNWYQIS